MTPWGRKWARHWLRQLKRRITTACTRPAAAGFAHFRRQVMRSVIDSNGPPWPADKYDAPRFMADKSPVGFHVMIKPVGSACSLNCTYCFYLSKATLPSGPGLRNMSDDTLELLIRSYIRDVTASEVVFTWQGGEPTLRGLDFFRKAVALQQKYAKPGQTYEVIFVRPGVKK